MQRRSVTLTTGVRRMPDARERLDDWLEELRVRWFMLDAQQKQALVLLSLYLGYTLLDVGGAVLKARIAAQTKGTA